MKVITQSQGGKKHAMKGQKTNCIGRILRRKCLLKEAVEGRIEIAGRRIRKSKQLLADLKENRGC
jgi:hypothetical protein